MRIHPLSLLLVVAVPALVKASTDTSCFSGCKCDVIYTRTLKIRDCERPIVLSQKTLNDFFKEISVISLKNVKITQIEDDAFTGFEDVNTVRIEDAIIDVMGPKAFESLPELTNVEFIRTKFAESPILSSPYLEELFFIDCSLFEVPNLENLPALQLLNLANNFIKTVDDNTFSKCKSLENVTFANNSITKLSAHLFDKNSDLIELNLDYNPLTSLDFLSNLKLEVLSLGHCKLSTFDRRFTQNLTLLNSLDLSGNEISVLPIDVFEPLKELNYLDLSNNKLVELDDDIFLENGELDQIVLDNNQFEKLPTFQTNDNFFQTRSFSCKNCGLKSVKGSFENMKELLTLDLSNNKLKDLDGVFTELQSIKEIFLSYNEIVSVGVNSFGKNVDLETLDLSNNPLSPLDPVVFTSLPSLKKLNVSSTGIKSLWANNNAVLPSLEELFVDNNQLSGLTKEDIIIIPKYKLIDLRGNPLECNRLYELVEYLTANSMYPKGNDMRTHEEMKLFDAEVVYKSRPKWNSVLPSDCPLTDDIIEDDSVEEEDYEDEADIDEIPEYEKVEDGEDDGVEASVLTTNGFDLAKASYILSITSVFILTALLVLFIAVVITLLILKKNRAFSMHNGNLPRLKIPLWNTTPGQKKHSGSVYRPLSEELSGPRTPIINRYEFNQTPSVHNSLP